MSISPEEQDRLALPEHRDERIARLRAYYADLHRLGVERRGPSIEEIEDFIRAFWGKDKRDAFRNWVADGAPNPYEWEYCE